MTSWFRLIRQSSFNLPHSQFYPIRFRPGARLLGFDFGARVKLQAHDGIRTRDLFLTKEVLYRLSYMGPVVVVIAQSHYSPVKAIQPPASKMERETGLEPATPSLEGSRSTN